MHGCLLGLGLVQCTGAHGETQQAEPLPEPGGARGPGTVRYSAQALTRRCPQLLLAQDWPLPPVTKVAEIGQAVVTLWKVVLGGGCVSLNDHR